MGLEYVYKLIKDNNGVRYLLVRPDWFDRTIDAKGKKKQNIPKKRPVQF